MVGDITNYLTTYCEYLANISIAFIEIVNLDLYLVNSVIIELCELLAPTLILSKHVFTR